MINQFESAFNVTIDTEKAVSNKAGGRWGRDHSPGNSIFRIVDRQLTVSKTPDVDGRRGSTRPDALRKFSQTQGRDRNWQAAQRDPRSRNGLVRDTAAYR
jgi:hypothetical protein